MSADSSRTSDRDSAAPETEATGTVAGIESRGDGPAVAAGDAFGPLDDPPRVEGVELIGEPIGILDTDEQAAEAEPVKDSNDGSLSEGLESADSASNPFEQQPGFVLPGELMSRVVEIERATAAIASQIAEIEHLSQSSVIDDPASELKES